MRRSRLGFMNIVIMLKQKRIINNEAIANRKRIYFFICGKNLLRCKLFAGLEKS